MKPTSTAVARPCSPAAMDGARGRSLIVAECFTFTTTIGAIYTWTNVDFDVAYNGLTFLAIGPLVQGLKFKHTVGLEVDKQQIIIAARPTDLINGAPFLMRCATAHSTARASIAIAFS